MDKRRVGVSGTETFDDIALDLQRLRVEAGPVSYAELVRRITQIRLERGCIEAAARPARSTVYNAFQLGRTRLDTDLLCEIVTALGANDSETAAWAQRSRTAHRSSRTSEESRPAVRATAAPESTREVTAETRARNEPRTPRTQQTKHLPVPQIAAVMCLSVLLNLVGLLIANTFKLTVYLDMVGTAISSIMLGPWHGVAVAIASNGLGFLTGDLKTLEFTPVNIVGALVWGYGIRRFAMGRNLPRFITLNLLTAATCSLAALPLVLQFFHGYDGHASNAAVMQLQELEVPFAVAVFITNIVTSVTDKLLTGFIALGCFVVLHNRLKVPADEVPLVEKLSAVRIEAPQPLVRA